MGTCFELTDFQAIVSDRAGLRCVDLPQEFGIRHDGPEWQQARYQEACRGPLGPSVVELSESCQPNVKHPQDTVRHADDTYQLGLAEQVLEWHGDAEQEDE